MNVSAPMFIRAINEGYEAPDYARDIAVSDELKAISKSLKEAFSSMSAWIKDLINHTNEQELEKAGQEMERLRSLFKAAFEELNIYEQMLPEPPDRFIALEMIKSIELAFEQEIGRETKCELPGFGFTSWGLLMVVDQDVEWDAPTVEKLSGQVSVLGWKNARQVLNHLASVLP